MFSGRTRVALIRSSISQMGRIFPWASYCFFLLVTCYSIADAAAVAELLTEADKETAVVQSVPSAGLPSTLYQFASQELRLKWTLAAGVRFDDVQWSIAGNTAGTSPNILSELSWTNILSHQLTLGGQAHIGRLFYFRAHLNYAWIQSGNVRDSDYAADNRTQEYSRSVSETNDDQLWDIVAGGGYPFSFRQKRIFAAPMAGVSIHRQSFRITNGEQVISEYPSETPPVGPLDNRLNSLYTADWRALWIGCDLRYEIAVLHATPPRMAWELSLKYFLLADFSAKADWNLRSDLQHPVSFKQDADAQGFCVQVTWLIYIIRHLDLSFNFNYSRWTTDAGVDTVYTAGGTPLYTRLNEVSWESHAVMVGMVYSFY